MWNDRLRLAERVQEDWITLSPEDKATTRLALERIDEDPIAGVPLYTPFQGLWSYQIGTMRVMYRIAPEAKIVVVLKIEKATTA